MNFHILTLFPDMVMQGLGTSIIGRAVNNGLLSIEAVNIRDYAFNKHQSVDDYPYGGGAGMLMQAEPVYQAYEAIAEKVKKKPRVVYLSPQGATFSQTMAEELAKEEELVLLCGHYEGIDERVLEEIVTDYVSIGDYVLTGGELPAMVMVDAISRLIRVCCTMMYPQNLNLFRMICWNIRSIRDLRNGMGKKFRRFFCPDITPILKSGEESSRSSGQRREDRIFWKSA